MWQVKVDAYEKKGYPLMGAAFTVKYRVGS
jgi:hypothetical protein